MIKGMNPMVIIALIAVAPTVLIALARARAAFVFMALCVGSVLSAFVGDQALDMVQLFARNYSAATQAGVAIGLLIAPALLTILFLNRTVSGSKWLINIIPAFLTGVTTLFLTVPLLSDGTQNAIYGTDLWGQLTRYQPLLIGAAALTSLIQLWAGGKAAKLKKNKHKK
jgi:hypothetical protein